MKKLPQNWRIIFTIAAVAVLFWFIWIFRAIIAYVIIAVVVAFICEPLADLLKRIRFKKFYFPSWLRALISLLTLVAVLFGLIAMFTPLVSTEVKLLSDIDPEEVANRLREQLYGIDQVTGNSGGSITESIIAGAQKIFSFEWIQSVFNNVFGFIGNIVVGIFAVLFIAFFFLKDGLLFTRMVFTITPPQHLEKIKRIMEHTHDLLKKYFIGVAIQSLIMSAMVGISLYVLGIQNAILIGLFAGIANVIPYLGPFLGGAIGILIALTTSLHLDFQTAVLPLLLRVGAVFVVAQQIDGFVVQPLVLGSSVKAHPLEIFIVVLMAGTVGGILGMVLAIPVYTIIRVVAKEFLSEFRIVDSLTRDLTDD
jgi:predicted PurR-regulated permease PerM